VSRASAAFGAAGGLADDGPRVKLDAVSHVFVVDFVNSLVPHGSKEAWLSICIVQR
jgi:hypothetical protein